VFAHHDFERVFQAASASAESSSKFCVVIASPENVPAAARISSIDDNGATKAFGLHRRARAEARREFSAAFFASPQMSAQDQLIDHTPACDIATFGEELRTVEQKTGINSKSDVLLDHIS
jgi:hypothetical protein